MLADRLLYPPRRVRGKPEPTLVIVLIDRLDQAEISLLDEILERNSALAIRFSDRDNEPEVRFD